MEGAEPNENGELSSGDSEEEEVHQQDAGMQFNTMVGIPNQAILLTRKHRANVRRKVLTNDTQLWARLRLMDREKTGLLPVRYFKEAISQHTHLTLDEMGWLVSQLRTRGGAIAYMELAQVLKPSTRVHTSGSDEEKDAFASKKVAELADEEGWSKQHGSLGEWLQYAATPMERRNFHNFVRTIEKFEQKYGLDSPSRGAHFGHLEEHSVVVRLGPTLNAQINFFVS